MSWELKTPTLLAHSAGHMIELAAGSWREPMEINPRIAAGVSGLEVVRLIREGLDFARKQPYQPAPKPKPEPKPFPKSNSTRPVLSLKRK